MTRPVFRVDPKLPVNTMKTYTISAPKNTHFRPATCEEVDCKHHREGWVSAIDESTDLGKAQAYFIRNKSGRHFKENRDQAPGLTMFVFEAGQRCFAQHDMRLDRPELFIVRDGDHRGNPTGRSKQHARPDDWVEDFAEHQQTLADQIEKG